MLQIATDLSPPVFCFGPGDEPGDSHRIIVEAMVALTRKATAVDTATIALELGEWGLRQAGGEVYIAECAQTLKHLGIENLDGLPEWATAVDNAGRLRNLSQVLTHYQERLTEAEAAADWGNADKVFADLLAQVSRNQDCSLSYNPIEVACELFLDKLNRQLTGEAITWMPIGWDVLNRMRIPPRGGLTIIKGLSSIGKSQLLAQLLLGGAIQLRVHNVPGIVALNTYEMTGANYIARMASSLCGVDLTSPDMAVGSPGHKKLVKAAQFIATLPIHYDDGDMTSTDVELQMTYMTAVQGQVHMLGLDFCELVPDEAGKSEELRIARIFRNCQRIGQQLGTAVIVVSQVSGIDNQTKLSGPGGTRYSKAGWHAASCMIELYNMRQMRENMMTFTVPDFIPAGVDAVTIVQKFKEGKTGWFPLLWEPECVRFRDPETSGAGLDAYYHDLQALWEATTSTRPPTGESNDDF